MEVSTSSLGSITVGKQTNLQTLASSYGLEVVMRGRHGPESVYVYGDLLLRWHKLIKETINEKQPSSSP